MHPKLAFFTLLTLVTCINSVAGQQMDYYPPLRDGVPQDWYEQGIANLEQQYIQLKTNRVQTTMDSLILFRNIAGMYAKLGEPADSVFYYIEKTLNLDYSQGCRSLLAHHRIMPTSKNGRFWRTVDSTRYDILYIKCRNYITRLDSEYRERDLRNENYDQTLIKLLELMLENDQKYRVYGQASLGGVNVDSLCQITDRRNAEKLDSIFARSGYPGKSRVGAYFKSYAATILLHAPLEYQVKHLPLVVKAYKQGEVLQADLLYLLDRIHWLQHNRQLFGTQYARTEGGRFGPVPLYEREQSLALLRELGLLELKDELR